MVQNQTNFTYPTLHYHLNIHIQQSLLTSLQIHQILQHHPLLDSIQTTTTITNYQDTLLPQVLALVPLNQTQCIGIASSIMLLHKINNNIVTLIETIITSAH
jgi:hypothetical protein